MTPTGANVDARRPASRLVHDALDLIDREGLAADRQQRRRLGEIDRRDHALDLGRDRQPRCRRHPWRLPSACSCRRALRAVGARPFQVKVWLLPALRR